MTRITPVHWKKLEQFFLSHGFKFACQTESHRAYIKKGTARPVIIPAYNEVKKADGDFEAHLVALSCGEPPEGFARWSLRLLADKVVELDYIDSISHEAVRRILKKTKLSPGNKKAG